METVPISSLSFDRFSPILGPRGAARLQATVGDAHALLGDRVIWHINSTKSGGGVAEMLQTLLGYERGAGLDARWLVIEGEPEFFTLTKRLHHRLHGEDGDGGPLGDAEHRAYVRVAKRNAEQVLKHVRPRDIVILHDPQTIGLAEALLLSGATVIWRCHIGRDTMNPALKEAWGFLKPYLMHAHAYVFSRPAYVPHWLGLQSVFIIPPAIDAFSVKNEPMSRSSCRTILRHIGLLKGLPNESPNGRLNFKRLDGSDGRVTRRAEIYQTAPVAGWRVPLVVQVSRWDPLKDMAGVMRGFADHLKQLRGAHLALVGPDVSGVTDDPEGAVVLQECVDQWRALPDGVRDRIHLVCLPMDDGEENAVMVNAIQRHATIVVQKSLHEGFGLTVTEAMWKGRPIVASAVGGIQDQITDGVHGVLLDAPTDLGAFGESLALLLERHQLARRLARNARRRAASRFLGPRQLTQHVDLLYAIEGKARARRAA